MSRVIGRGIAASLVLSCFLSGVAVGQTDFSKFPLAKAIPADVFIAIAEKGNPEREFLCEYWDAVIQEFLDQGILEDIWDLVSESMPDEDIDEVEALGDRFGELISSIEWGQLFDKEMIYAGRFRSVLGGGGVIQETLLMGRMDKKQATANYKALKVLLEEIHKLISQHVGEGTAVMTETKNNGVTMVVLGPSAIPQLGLALAHRKDVIALSIGNSEFINDAFGLLKGGSDKQALIETPRFKKAFADLPAAEDSLVFFDIDGMLGRMQSIFGAIAAASSTHDHAGGHDGAGEHEDAHEHDEADGHDEAHGHDEADGDGEAHGHDEVGTSSDASVWLGVIDSLLKEFSILDHMAAVEWTEGRQVFSETMTTLKPDARSSPLYGILSSGKRIKKFERFIPKEADNFSCSSGIDFSKLYRYLLGFAAENVPGAEQWLAEFARMQKEDWELDIEKDVLGLFDGSFVSATVGSDTFLMLGVTDEKKATGQVARLLATVNGRLGPEQGLIMTPVEVAGKPGFTQISHPMMMLFGVLQPPVIGCADGYLIVGSSAAAAARCLETGRGEHANITKNKRWRKEGLAPKSGAVDSICFTDESSMAEELQATFGGLSMVLGMAGMFMQDAPPELRSVFGALPPLLGKLAQVVGKLDFYQSSASYSTFDGSRWHVRNVQNYKPPKPKTPEPEAPADEGSKKKKSGTI